MKTAVCTHCGKAIEYTPAEGWYHVNPEPGLKPGFCRAINIAIPRRGSIEKT